MSKNRNHHILSVLNSLRLYCENRDFKGHDVCDGIASPILTKTILNHSAFIRFVFYQLTAFRIAYINIRPILFIPQYYNAKGIALFLNGYCNLYDLINVGIETGISKEYCLQKINYLANLLLNLQNTNYSGACWGYPTALQGRTKYYFPPNTPTVVATSFVVEALFHAYTITDNNRYKETAFSSSQFVLKDLHRTPLSNGFILSYSPILGNSRVYNASLLGARILIQCFKYSENEEYLSTAKQIIQACISYQSQDGSWVYGMDKSQGWIDNFHTGYNLEAIQAYQDISKDSSFQYNIDKGLNFMLNNHFEKNYTPKYYHNKKYPIDIHCCGEIFVVLNKLNKFNENKTLADSVFKWTIDNMWDKKKNYFYFQKHKVITNKAPLMRWNQAFMFNALTYYLKSINDIS